MDENISFDVLFDNNSLPITLPLHATVFDLKSQLEMYTNVPIHKQMLLGLLDNKNETELAAMELKNIEMVEVADATGEPAVVEEPHIQPQVLPPHPQPQPQPPHIPQHFIPHPRPFVPPQPEYIDADQDMDYEDENNDDQNNDDNIQDNDIYRQHQFAENYNARFGTGNSLTEFLDSVSYPSFASDYLEMAHMLVPTPFQGSYKDALTEARRTGRLVLAYLHSPQNPNADNFCMDILASEEIFEFINTNYVFWVGTINPTDEKRLLQLVPFEGYPIVGIVANFGGGTPELLHLLQANIVRDQFYNLLVNEITVNEVKLQRLRQEQEETDAQRRIVDEQNREYQESLRADIEKARKEEEEKKRVLAEAKAVENKKSEKLSHGKLVPPEPPKGPESTHIIFKLPDDTKIERRFNSTDTIQTLAYFLDGSGVELENYQFSMTFPRKVFGKQQYNLTLKETDIHPQCLLNVRSEDD
ncbi:hypothetical protein SAMD00019534_026610 [Acytostelium subglobosum LB1]|uniref:hypothetical protein n=1 Tax=Acytostelium subglobosum LB1 TaxID=1410327 RepID=UPI000644CF50|nr:hypothetical protein SAMD00019534_026610 [Acytostelium subglobosum LB1]GAM19486.1 hypothetical protein SAMD00019534_026610 [Acytostelium subglobosum LB1]|eukprot:XP_012757413.1 hypothetical protein SAMD00019534_026610 [Acytostelium subglobosum LB1]